MASRLELVLLEDDRMDGKIRRTLFDILHRDDIATVLRLCSRVLHDLVDQMKARVFRDCFFSMPIGRLGINYSITALKRIAPYCTRLTIKVMFSDENSPYTMGEAVIEDQNRKQAADLRRREFERSRPSGGIARAMWNARNQFREDPPAASIVATSAQRKSPASYYQDQILVEHVLQSLPRVTILDIQINGEPGWPGVTQVEDAVITLRHALEGSGLPALRTVCFHPVHAAGMIHLRWSSFGAFCNPPSLPQERSLPRSAPQSGKGLWAKLTMLDLQIRNPGASGRVGARQMMMFFQVLEDYLRSFSRTLKCLHFVWLDAPGPSPVSLPDLLERDRIIWPHLGEFWNGNITSSERTLSLVKTCMPHVKDLRVVATSTPGETPCKDWMWQPVHVGDCQRKRPLCLLQPEPEKQLSQLSLVPAPLALSKAAAAVQPEAGKSSESNIYSGNSSVSDLSLTPGDDNNMDGRNGMAEPQKYWLHVPPLNIEKLPALREKQDAGHDHHKATSTALKTTEHRASLASRLPVTSSIYSRDMNGDYFPVRHQWHRLHSNSTQRQQQKPLQVSRGYTAVLDAGRRLSASLNNPNPTVLPSASYSLQKERPRGHRPPPVPPARSAVKKNFIDLGNMPAYQAARSQYLRQHQDPALKPSYAADHVHSPETRIKQWAQAVESGRPTSAVSVTSMDTVNTIKSRPLSRFLANLRETGKPTRLTRQHGQSQLQ